MKIKTIVHKNIRVKGIVQGVGFRPFIYNLAGRNTITGYVINDTEGVFIEAEGTGDDVDRFISAISESAPPLSHVQSVDANEGEVKQYESFTIEKSRETGERSAFYSPHIALCDDCLAEFFDPEDRRHRYPFITCINCGPRFSMVRDMPYDRHTTSMANFTMCPECEEEYRDPENRRFHTQPNACPTCGPGLALNDRNGTVLETEPGAVAEKTVSLLREGKILAIKGVGGYHLAVDARNDRAVEELRARKNRPFKPFALMAADLSRANEFLEITPAGRKLLLSKERPIVLLREKSKPVSDLVAPGLSYQGIMLPYTPFQHLLFDIAPDMVLVMTSGNLSDEPIVYADSGAFTRLEGIADYFVTYNREILSQSDDSVFYVVNERPYVLRRSRGYVPAPFGSRNTGRVILALGGDLKNSFAVARKDFVIQSQYLGDMADMETHRAFRETVSHFIKVFDAEPDLIVSDLHPGYMTSSFAEEFAARGLESLKVQHHHAHAVSVMEERDLEGPVIGISFDGTGYGPDGTLWGSEFFLVNRDRYERAGHFTNFPLPGGESAIHDVWKIGLSLLYTSLGVDYSFDRWRDRRGPLIEIIDKNIHSPLTCSIGRVFDGVSAILGIRETVSSEAEAAILLEEAAYRGKSTDSYRLPFTSGDIIEVDTGELVRYVADLVESKKPVDDIARLFHLAIVGTSVDVAKEIMDRTGLDRVVLSGGVFHNRIILSELIRGLEGAGFRVFLPERVPVNDQCISLGQVAVAKAVLEQGG